VKRGNETTKPCPDGQAAHLAILVHGLGLFVSVVWK